MINRDELKTVTGAVPLGVGAEVTLGPPILINTRRFIYRVKFINLGAGVNALVLGKRENGALITVNVDTIQAVVPNEMVTDPDELKEDAAPLYVIDGGPTGTALIPGATSLVRVYGDIAAGICTYWYLDASA